MTPCAIVAYRNVEALDRLIESIETQTVLAEPWVHDNSLRNIGLTRGANKLLALATMGLERYVLWLSHDAVLEPECVENAIAFMDAHPRCAVAGFKQIDPDDRDTITHGGCTDAYPSGVHLTGKVSRGDCATSARMPWINMGACIFRVDALQEIGLLDERLELYGQDSEWCFRANASGLEVWYCAEAVCYHKGGCAQSPTPEQIAIFHKDMATWAEIVTSYPQMQELLGE